MGGCSLLVLLAGVGCSGQGGVPAELIGYWTTSTPRYEGRAFALTDSTLTIFVAREDSSVYEIVGTQLEDHENGALVRIEYQEAGDEYLFRLGYGPAGADGAPEWVHPAEQPEIEWTKTPRGS